MVDKLDIKKWTYFLISDDTSKVFENFNKLYDIDREAARYYMYDTTDYLSSIKLYAYINKDVQIIIKEKIRYGVSISLKRYKSTKIIQKLYFNTKTGAISKYSNGKFINCTPADVLSDIKNYIISQLKWTEFVFQLNLPISFSTIVNKKLYSERKLLSYYWNTNYPTARKLNKAKNEFKDYFDYYFLVKNKNIVKNIENINSLFFTDREYIDLFLNNLRLSIVTLDKINSTWSYKRHIHENKRLNLKIINKLYESGNYDVELTPEDIFLPVIKFLENSGHQIIYNINGIIKYFNKYNLLQIAISYLKSRNSLAFVSNNELIIIYHSDFNDNRFNVSIGKDINGIVKTINNNYRDFIKIYDREKKIEKINTSVFDDSIFDEDYFNINEL
jgi:hypothetical protein